MIVTTALTIGLVAGIGAAPAFAGNVTFSGTRQNINFLNPPGTGRCAPSNTVNISPDGPFSAGTSNLGDFVYTQSHCIAGPPGPANPLRELTEGEFLWEFATGNSLFGIYIGQVVFEAGIVTGTEWLTVMGGTGRFLDATGSINNMGTLTFGMFEGTPAGFFSGTFDGVLDAPAIPEPASWALMIAGFGLVGAALRRRRVACASTRVQS